VIGFASLGSLIHSALLHSGETHRATEVSVLRTRGFSIVFGAIMAACAPAANEGNAPAPSALDPSSAASRGTVVAYTMRFDDGTGETQYFLRSGDKELRLHFEDDPGLEPGAHIRVSGEATSDGLRVDSFQLDEPVGAASQALITGMTYKPRSFAFVLVDTGAGVNLTKAEAQKRLFGTNPGDKSVKQYYNEVSYGTQDITGDVFGPLTYKITGCDTRGLATALKPQLGTFDHYLWYMGARNASCSWSGLAESGQPSKPTNDSWYNGSAGCVVLVQEPGHNFGMSHSSSMTCGTTAAFADNPEAACTHSEYGDRYDPMGGACNHMNAWQKVFEGWLQKCNGVSVKASGMYTLQPLELACDGPQVLQIPMPKVRPFSRAGGGGAATTENIQYYYLELRTARGFDDTIRSAPTVLVHVAEDFRSRTERGRHTWILDMDPSTRTIDGLVAGKTFTDPAGGVSFQVVSASMESASIQVTIPGGTGGAVCLDDTVYDPAVPRACAGLVGPSGISDAGVLSDAGPDAGSLGTPPPRVEALVLVNADTDMDIAPVDDGQVLDLNQLPPNLTLRVETDPPSVGSVTFRIDGGLVRTESIAPYSISSDDGRGNFAPWTLALGAHTVLATPYDGADAGGREGEPLEVDFILTRGGATGTADAGAGGLDGGAAGGDGGTASGTNDSGTVVVANPATSADGSVAGSQDSSVPSEQSKDESGCSCHVPGAGTGAVGTRRSWALAALALGLFMRRRRQRSQRR
jgi:MYXO-CTERM domain-containing protein